MINGSIRKQMKISFFENVFYWLWNWGERRNEQAAKEGSSLRVALPERSFAFLAFSQYVYFMFFVVLILHTLNNETIIKLYKIDDHLTILPLMYILITLFLINLIIYGKNKYKKLKEKYAQMSDAERQETKKTFTIYFFVSILTGIVTVILWFLYNNRVKEIVGNEFSNLIIK